MYKKVKPEEAIYAVEKYLSGKVSISQLCHSLDVSYDTVSKWIRNYQNVGPDTFYQKGWTRRSAAIKSCAVQDYLAGKGSLRDVCRKYQISDTKTLRQWILKYNGHKELKDSGTGGSLIMTKGRKTTFEERVEIVEYCIAHEHNYNETAEKYQISYQQARNYTVKYESNGVEGLQDKRGRRKPESEMSELERLKAENKILRAEKKHAEMETSFLKKLVEIERRWG